MLTNAAEVQAKYISNTGEWHLGHRLGAFADTGQLGARDTATVAQAHVNGLSDTGQLSLRDKSAVWSSGQFLAFAFDNKCQD